MPGQDGGEAEYADVLTRPASQVSASGPGDYGSVLTTAREAPGSVVDGNHYEAAPVKGGAGGQGGQPL